MDRLSGGIIEPVKLYLEFGICGLLSHLALVYGGSFPGFLKLFYDNRLEIFKGSGLCDASVYEYSGGTPDAHALAQLGILVDSQDGYRVIQVFFKFFHVEVQFAGDLPEFLIVQVVVILEKPVVILPEFFLLLGCRCRDGSFFRIGMTG